MDLERFEDEITVELSTIEALAYRKPGFMVEIVFDYYELGWFKSGRILFLEEVKCWDVCPSESDRKISQECKLDIQNKCSMYFQKRGIDVRLS